MYVTQRMALARLHRATQNLRSLELAPAMPATCEMVLRSIREQIERDLIIVHDFISPPTVAHVTTKS